MKQLPKAEEQARQARRGGLIEFIRYFWDVLEPETELVDGWPLEAICAHLEAVTFGEVNRLLINVPPGFMKSLLTDVFWPAWEWGPMRKPHLRYATFSYSASLTERDNGRFRDLTTSKKFIDLWGHVFSIVNVGVQRVSNNKTGWKLASSVGGVATGERGDRVILDDPHSVKDSESEVVRTETVRWFRESMSNRLNDMEKSAIVIIMQRVHEDDVSGAVLTAGMDYVHLCIPMQYEETRHCETEVPWTDPRAEEGELAWEARFPPHIVEKMRRDLGPYAYAGQYQQAPVPRGGGIFKREWWQVWEPEDGKWPPFDYIVASVDTAFTQKQENDPSAMTVWGIWHDAQSGKEFDAATGKIWERAGRGRPRAMLIKAWSKYLEMHGTLIEQEEGETYAQWRRRAEKGWGLVEWVAETCRFRRSDGTVIGTVDRLLIEAKASGITAAQEIQRLYGTEGWITELVDVKGDKVARAHAIVPLFSNGLVYAPNRAWADAVIDQCATFPRGKDDDYVDSTTQALRHLRVGGMLRHAEEIRADIEDQMKVRKKLAPLYPT